MFRAAVATFVLAISFLIVAVGVQVLRGNVKSISISLDTSVAEATKSKISVEFKDEAEAAGVSAPSAPKPGDKATYDAIQQDYMAKRAKPRPRRVGAQIAPNGNEICVDQQFTPLQRGGTRYQFVPR
jgi:hypothetical protein